MCSRKCSETASAVLSSWRGCLRRCPTGGRPAELGRPAGADPGYNPRRVLKRVGYLSPIECEEKHYTNQTVTEQANMKPCHLALIR